MNSGLKLSSIITGTGPAALAGVVSVRSMFTEICGYDELSTCPASLLVMMGTSPFISRVVLTISQFTFGVLRGIRP